jgi:parallel beta-helix repeat protein
VTVPSENSSITYTGDSTTDEFAFPYRFLANAHLRVVRTVIATGVETELTLDSGGADGFSVTGAGDPAGGEITVVTPPTSLQTLTIDRGNIPATQEQAYIPNTTLPAQTVERALDKLTMLVQNIAAGAIARVLRLVVGDTDGSGRYNANGNRIVDMEDAVDPTDAATLQQVTAMSSGSFIQAGTGAVVRTMQDKAREWVTPDDFSGATDTIKLNAALATGKRVRIPSGKNYSITTVDMAVAGTSISIDAGGSITLTDAAAIGINVTADDCAILGAGKIVSPASWDGTTARPTIGVVWVEGDNFSISGVTFENIPRIGIRIEDGTNWRIENCHLIGNYPYASFTGTQTGHCAISYNPPADGGSTTASGNGSGIVVGNRIESSVQGFHQGNYDAAASAVGVVISGNQFNRCWNHGIYMQSAKGVTVTGNNFTNCQNPMVVDGTGATVSGNSLYATELVLTNAPQVIEVRDAEDALIADNNLYGIGAAIYVGCVTGSTLRRVKVRGNSIYRTGPNTGLTEAAIRIGASAQICDDCEIVGNTVAGNASFGVLGAIQAVMVSSSYKGLRTRIVGNTIHHVESVALAAVPNILYVTDHDYAEVSDNTLICETVGAGAATLTMIKLNNTSYFDCSRNRFIYTDGGTNITARGIHVNGSPVLGGRVCDNDFFLSAAGLTAAALTFVGSNAHTARNRIDATAKLSGTATVGTGTATVTVTNANCLSAFNRVSLVATNAAAAQNIAAKGFYVTLANGSFTINTGDATNVAANCTFAWTLD